LTWTPFGTSSLSGTLNAIALEPSGTTAEHVFVATSSALYRYTATSTAAATQTPTGAVAPFRALALDPRATNKTLLVVTDARGIFRTGDALAATLVWTTANAGLPTPYPRFLSIVMDPSNPDVVFATAAADPTDATPGGVFKSTDNGRSWVRAQE